MENGVTYLTLLSKTFPKGTGRLRVSVDTFLGNSLYCKFPANHRIWYKARFLSISGHSLGLLHGCCTQSALGKIRTCDLLILSQDTCV